MKTLKFELDGRAFRVYVDRDGAVFVDVKDILGPVDDEKTVREYLADWPYSKICGRPVWEESDFFHIWLDDMAADKLIFFYLSTVQPKIRQEVMIMAEKSWTESKKVRQLEEDLNMNLGERRKAEERLAKQSSEFDAVLDRFVHICADNGAMSRLLLEISRKSDDKNLCARISDVLKKNAILNTKTKQEPQVRKMQKSLQMQP